ECGLDPRGSNAGTARDFVNELEYLFVEPPLGSDYPIAVVGRRVSVNAVTANTQDVVQDYALVVSSGEGELTNAFVSLRRESDDLVGRPALISLTDGVPLLEQRVGANFQLSPGPNGDPDQW